MNFFKKKSVSTMSSITVNGKRYDNIQGNNISVINGVIKVDGKVIEEGLSGVVEVKWEGELANLTSSASVTAGNVKGDVDAGGSVQCMSVGGSIDCGGSVQCDDVAGSIDSGGSVTCGNVTGNIDAGGSVRRN